MNIIAFWKYVKIIFNFENTYFNIINRQIIDFTAFSIFNFLYIKTQY